MRCSPCDDTIDRRHSIVWCHRQIGQRRQSADAKRRVDAAAKPQICKSQIRVLHSHASVTGVPTPMPNRSAALSRTMANSSRPLEPISATKRSAGLLGIGVVDAPRLVDVADDARAAIGGAAGEHVGRDVGDQVAERVDLDHRAVDPGLTCPRRRANRASSVAPSGGPSRSGSSPRASRAATGAMMSRPWNVVETCSSQ